MNKTDIIAAAIAIALGGSISDNTEVNALANEMMGAKATAIKDMKG